MQDLSRKMSFKETFLEKELWTHSIYTLLLDSGEDDTIVSSSNRVMSPILKEQTGMSWACGQMSEGRWSKMAMNMGR